MSKKLKKIEGVRQVGPTCGIFALAMIITGYEDGNIKRCKEVVYQILEYALKEKITKVGELFTKDSLERLIDGINDSDILRNDVEIECIVEEFNTEEDLRVKISEAIDSEYYIMFPYYSSGGKVVTKKRIIACAIAYTIILGFCLYVFYLQLRLLVLSQMVSCLIFILLFLLGGVYVFNMKHVHWGVIDEIDNERGFISGTEGHIENGKSKFDNTAIKKIFSSNSLVKCNFYWAPYYVLKYVIEAVEGIIKPFNIILSPKKTIEEPLDQEINKLLNTKNESTEIQKIDYKIKVDLAGNLFKIRIKTK